MHANTWRYNQLIAQQRAILVERRDTLLRTPTAREELEKKSPKRYEELAEELSEERLEKICRLIMLYHLDRGWADHLAYLADIRESIHLRALGRQNPSTSSTGWPSTRSPRWPPTRSRRLSRPSRPRLHRGRAGRRPVQAREADVDVDVHGARQPAGRRHDVGAEPARGIPLGLAHGTRASGGRARSGADGAQRAVGAAPGAGPGLPLPAAGRHANGWAVAVLMFSGFSDWADGKIARLVANQSSRLGELLDPAVDRIYMVTVPVALAVHGSVPWWIVLTLIGRDAMLAATLPLLRSRGLDRAAGDLHRQGATFALMSAFPIDPARPVGRVVEPRDPGLWVGILDLGAGAVFVVGRALPDPGGHGDASDAEAGNG